MQTLTTAVLVSFGDINITRQRVVFRFISADIGKLTEQINE
jgi:hypothetical protein